MKPRIDPNSPIPLYHQIAEAIRFAIRAGKLSPGDALDPMRRAAERWRVNMHTVRHAYAALARDGLIDRSRGPRGTRVAGIRGRKRKRSGEDLGGFLDRIRREAFERYGLGPAELAGELRGTIDPRRAERPAVFVVECSEWQCDSHVREIESRFRVEARGWPLDRDREPPTGPVISTYFHYNDIRRRWPRRLSRIHFLTIYPDPGLRRRLAGIRRVLVCERDRDTAETVAADLSALFGEKRIEVSKLVREDPSGVPLRSGKGPPLLFSPRVWAELPETIRSHPRAMELRYVLDAAELDGLGERLRWEHRRGSAA